MKNLRNHSVANLSRPSTKAMVSVSIVLLSINTYIYNLKYLNPLIVKHLLVIICMKKRLILCACGSPHT